MQRICSKKCFIWFWVALLLVSNGCAAAGDITRNGFLSILVDICKSKYQTHITCKEVGDTVWVYLPYTPGRSGLAASKEEGNDLYLEYRIASFNPYRTLEPPELKFLIQKVLGETRKLLLRTVNPYNFFVLVVTDIADEKNKSEDWHMGYFDDLKKFSVCKDFSGEGYSRLAWHKEKLEAARDNAGEDISSAYTDVKGEHVRYHEITLREFIDKQIKWRVYKKFTLEYNKTPFDLTAQEKQDEVLNIVQTVLQAYNFKEYEKIYLKDSSFLDDQSTYIGYSRAEWEKNKAGEVRRPPAF